MANFKNPKNQPVQNEAILCPSETRSPKSGTRVPPKSRKSRKSKDIKHRRVQSPPSRSHVGLSFLSLIGVYGVLRDYVNGSGCRFDSDKFVMLLFIGSYGDGGCSGRGLHLVMCGVLSGSTYRAMSARLVTLVRSGLVTRVRDGNGYRYSLSGVCVRLIGGVVGRGVLRDVVELVRMGLAS